MKALRHLAIVALLGLSGCAIDDPANPMVRMNLSGAITTTPMLGMETMKKRGVETVAFVLKEENRIEYQHTSITVFGNKTNSFPLDQIMDRNPNRRCLNEYLNDLDGIRFVDVSEIEGEIISKTFYSKWDGKVSFAKDGEDIRQRLEDMGVDVLLVANEDPYPDNDVAWSIKSFFGNDSTYNLMGMYQVAVVDVASGKQIKNCNYIQGSLEPVQLVSDFSKGELKEEDKDVLRRAIWSRADNNALEALRMLKFIERE